LASRRIRLYVLAYLRGFLKPDFQNGNASIIREDLLLHALDMELQAHEGELLTGVFASFYAARPSIKDGFKEVMAIAKKTIRMRELDPKALKEDKGSVIDSSVDALASMYKMLKETGALNKL